MSNFRVLCSVFVLGSLASAAGGCMDALDERRDEAQLGGPTTGDQPVEPDGDGEVHVLATAAPGCVERHVESGFAWVVNDCSSVQRVKIVIAHGYDSQCYSLAARGGIASHIWNFGTYDGTYLC
jgi:hypothetical protein